MGRSGVGYVSQVPTVPLGAWPGGVPVHGDVQGIRAVGGEEVPASGGVRGVHIAGSIPSLRQLWGFLLQRKGSGVPLEREEGPCLLEGGGTGGYPSLRHL